MLSRPAARRVALMLLTLAALVLPRVYAFWGVQNTAAFVFADPAEHLVNADRIARLSALSTEQRQDPYLARHPELAAPLFEHKYPHGVYRVTGLWLPRLGPLSLWTTQLTNLLFTLILLVGTVGLGRVMGGWRVGLYAGLLVLLCPALVASSWYYGLDYPLVAMVTAGLLLLHRTDGFSRPGAVLAFAAWSVLGLLVKMNYAIYLLCPAVACLALGLRRGPRPRVLALAALATALTAGLFLLLHGVSPATLWDALVLHAGSRARGIPVLEPLSLWWWLAVPAFAAMGFPWPLLLPALAGFVAAHRRRAGALRWLLLALLWGGALLLTLMLHKRERYVQPLYPALCLLGAWWVLRVVAPRWRLALAAVVAAAFAAVLVATHSWPAPWPVVPLDRDRPLSSAASSFWYEGTMPTRAQLAGLRRNVTNARCRLEPLTRQIAAWSAARADARPLGLAYLPGHQRSEPPGLAPVQFYNMVLASLPVIHGRLVVLDNIIWTRNPLPPALARAPHLVVIHPHGVEPRRLAPGLVLVQRRDVALRCDDGVHHYQLTLARPR